MPLPWNRPLRQCYRSVFGSRIALILFLMALVAYGYFFHRFRFWNVNSRLALTYAIVDQGTFRIDDYVNHPYYETFDRAYYDGHFYSDKIIGLSLLAVPPYWVMKHLLALVGKDPKPDVSRYGLTVAVVSLSSAFLLVVLFRFLLLLGAPPGRASSVVLFTAFGTMVFPFSCLFYPYMPAAFFLVTALYLICAWSREGTLDSKPSWPLGALIGLSLLCDYTMAIPAGLICLYYFSLLRKKARILPSLVTSCMVLSVFAAYNTACFQNPFTLPYRYLDHQEFHDGMSQGFMGIHRFQWYALYLITLHPYRGIFFYSPFLLLSVASVFCGLRRKNMQDRLLAGMVVAIVAYYLCLNASYYMWWGGGTLLARHLTPMVPFLVLALAWLPDRFRKLLLLAGMLSVLLMGVQSVVEPHFESFYSNDDLYRPWETVQRTGKGFTPPFFSHSLPEFLKGRISMNPFNLKIYATDGKLWTLLPLLAIEAALLFCLRRNVRRLAKEENA